MTNAGLILGVLAATTSAAAVSNIAPQSSPVMYPQVAQSLPAERQVCQANDSATKIVNKCDFPIHIWRDDSSVDKAAVLEPKAVFYEPMRQDWRSGLMSYRMSPYANVPNIKLSDSLFLSYVYRPQEQSTEWTGILHSVLGNPFEDWATGVSFSPRCAVQDAGSKPGIPAGSKHITQGAVIKCAPAKKDPENGLLIEVTLCA